MHQLICELEALDLNCTANYADLGTEVFAQADHATAEFEQRTEIVAADRPLAAIVRTLLDELLAGEPDSRSIGEGCQCRPGQSFAYFSKSAVRVVVLPQDAPLAQAYPNGTVYVTAGLVDATLPYAAKNDAQLIGVLAHELVHLRAGHVFLQWAFLEGRNRQNIKLAASQVSSFLSLASRLSPATLIVPSYTYESVPLRRRESLRAGFRVRPVPYRKSGRPSGRGPPADGHVAGHVGFRRG